jgi:hypothetical protein
LPEETMTHRIALQDVARIVLPFGLFIGVFGHGAGPALGLALCAVCVGVEVSTRMRAVRAA